MEHSIGMLPDSHAPAIGDEYSTTIGRIVVYQVWANGEVGYYLNGEAHSCRAFHLMLRSIADVTPMMREYNPKAHG
jgi:hypothetical protein